MDPRYQWPQQGYPNGQYIPPQPNGYPANGYPQQYPQQQSVQQTPPGYPQSQPIQSHPRVVIPPRSSQPYPPVHDGAQVQPPRPAQPQVVIPARTPAFMPHMNNPRIRQVQVPVQRPALGSSNGVNQSNSLHSRPPQAQMPQRSQSLQQTTARPQQRTPSLPASSQHRSPMQPQPQPQLTPKQARSQQSSPNQHPSSLPYTVSSQHKSHPKVIINKQTTPQPLHKPSGAHHAPPAKALPTDLAVLLLSTADEYINAARRIGSVAAMGQSQADLAQYYKFMATGLGCMDTVLKKFNQAPRDEAKLRLRYASLLIEETDNNAEIDAVLTKGISLCDRSRLHDLKYSMQHLQARYQFQSNHRAALKSLDKPISDAETFQHIVWVYAFRFLKVSLALQVPARPETASALQQLHVIAAHAERQGDRAISVTCSALEAMIHLRSPSPDHIEHAQRAIAAARSHQLQLSTKQLGQIAALIDAVDIACGLKRGVNDLSKMQALQQKVDNDPGPDDGVFSVLIEKSFGGNSTLSTGGIFRKAEDGRDELTLAWLPKKDLKMLAYYLSGMMSLPHDKGFSYMQEGFKLTQDSLRRYRSYSLSIPASISQKKWLKVLDWQIRFSLGILACYHDDKAASQRQLEALQSQVGSPPFTTDLHGRLASYLSGILEQTKGFLDSALSIYSSEEFTLPSPGPHSHDFSTDLAILAGINRLLIIRNPAHPQHYLAGALFSQLEPLCTNHPNAYIEIAFRIMRALTSSDASINRQKTLVQTALNAAQKSGNNQFIVMCLNHMTARFFTDIVSEQATKAARASRQVARQSKSSLWLAVSHGICINTFQRNGYLDEASASRQAFEEIKDRLSTPLKASLGRGYVPDGDVDMLG
ncbi:hypothetical protein CC78DRAFT_529545 [Lojkania enalia]|uniref:75k gamma secalin n=1 Tax=Lojkania enalia TaxID=147567 RepID=A0A9P4KJU6_9PLEO|nr:hypothetical protein CC78DRAFT_529545 [Didymosphaeria enalia]